MIFVGENGEGPGQDAVRAAIVAEHKSYEK
jgi:hypothetical protein